MEIQQLELDLWQSLETAAKFPQTADFPKLCNALDSAIAPQSTSEQLILGAEAIAQLSHIYAARVELLLCGWEQRYNPIEPVIDLDDCVGLFVQSLNLDVADLFEPLEAVQYPTNRQARTQVNPDNSLAGTVDKAVLLEVVNRMEEEHLPTEAEFAEQLRQLAGEEDIETWQSAIAHQMTQVNTKVCLADLQQALEIPLVNIWLGLILSGEEQYEWETDGEFYHDAGKLWLRKVIKDQSRHEPHA